MGLTGNSSLTLSILTVTYSSYFATFSAINETLAELDLSWNHIRGKGALAVAIGLKVNTTVGHSYYFANPNKI